MCMVARSSDFSFHRKPVHTVCHPCCNSVQFEAQAIEKCSLGWSPVETLSLQKRISMFIDLHNGLAGADWNELEAIYTHMYLHFLAQALVWLLVICCFYALNIACLFLFGICGWYIAHELLFWCCKSVWFHFFFVWCLSQAIFLFRMIWMHTIKSFFQIRISLFHSI